jgi:hypothetical protein
MNKYYHVGVLERASVNGFKAGTLESLIIFTMIRSFRSMLQNKNAFEVATAQADEYCEEAF